MRLSVDASEEVAAGANSVGLSEAMRLSTVANLAVWLCANSVGLSEAMRRWKQSHPPLLRLGANSVGLSEAMRRNRNARPGENQLVPTALVSRKRCDVLLELRRRER